MSIRLSSIRLKRLSNQDRLERYLIVYANDKMTRRLGLLTAMEVPTITKAALNIGLGKHKNDRRTVSNIGQSFTKVTGQVPTTTKASRAIASFKIRRHEVIGLRVSVRGRKLYELMDRLVNFAVPRIRDFRGISLGSFDNDGNLTIGLSECSVFPELSYDKTSTEIGMNVSIVIVPKDKALAVYLLSLLNFPLKRE